MSAHLACIIGWPLDRSLSPVIHNAAFAALDLDWTYLPIAVRPGAVEEGVALLRTLEADGANVTIPHKEVVIPFLDAVDGEAQAFGAVNTIVRDGGLLVGSNTDGAGFLRALGAGGIEPAGATALVLGAGGAARAVAKSLAQAGAAVTVSARREAQAAGLGLATVPWGSGAADLVVNATPAREGLPLGVLAQASVAVDLIYQPPETEFLASARERGAVAMDGLPMLVHQAALSFERWTGRDAPFRAMWDAASSARAAAG